MIAAERAKSERRAIRVWHQGAPSRPLLSVADPPRGSGRYHRAGGTPTWYGSTSQTAAWAELFRHTIDPIERAAVRRRIGSADYNVVALDLTSPAVQRALGLTTRQLTADDLEICQTLADISAAAGFDAILGPSAAVAGESTLAVFGKSITAKASAVVDLGARSAHAT